MGRTIVGYPCDSRNFRFDVMMSYKDMRSTDHTARYKHCVTLHRDNLPLRSTWSLFQKTNIMTHEMIGGKFASVYLQCSRTDHGRPDT